MAEKVIIDTDPGIDDSMAIFYALNSPEIELLALTTIFGNASTIWLSISCCCFIVFAILFKRLF